ncbi:MAG: glycosyltransferase family 2 protein [Cyclobacteriaceae bacterium]|nr:glycosyltransferase family 2 protein [Cyclobacteriaceae bacterium]
MHFFKNPRWIDDQLFLSKKLEEVPPPTLESIRLRLKSKMSDQPVVTIVIAAWNEEVNIIRCLDTLSRNETEIPFDIIVINNNSSDRTQDVLDQLGVQSYFQPVQGCGPARDLGQRMAKGEYILIADADCFYPPHWIDIMSKGLRSKNVVFVYGRFSFLGNEVNPRWQFSLYDIFRDLMVEVRHIKRPYLSAYGISMGYVKKFGLQEGYLERNIRGDDGRLCFDLMKYGEIRIIRSSKARVWTSNRTLQRDGSLFISMKRRIFREIARFDKYVTKPEPHNTKTSSNEDYTIEESIKIIKQKYNPFNVFLKIKNKK